MIRIWVYEAVYLENAEEIERIANAYGMTTSLTKPDIIKNKAGIYVSRKKHASGKKIYKTNNLNTSFVKMIKSSTTMAYGLGSSFGEFFLLHIVRVNVLMI